MLRLQGIMVMNRTCVLCVVGSKERLIVLSLKQCGGLKTSKKSTRHLGIS